VDRDIKIRLAQLVRLLSSPVDGEVVAAARALTRTLAAHKLTIHDLATLVEGGTVSRAVAPVEHWRDKLDACLQRTGGLTDWDLGFLYSIGRRNRLTPKQERCLNDIWERVRRG